MLFVTMSKELEVTQGSTTRGQGKRCVRVAQHNAEQLLKRNDWFCKC